MFYEPPAARDTRDGKADGWDPICLPHDLFSVEGRAASGLHKSAWFLSSLRSPSIPKWLLNDMTQLSKTARTVDVYLILIKPPLVV